MPVKAKASVSTLVQNKPTIAGYINHPELFLTLYNHLNPNVIRGLDLLIID